MIIKRIYEVISIIKKSKYKAYLVGGSSRDFIFSREFEDVDIATNAPLEFIRKTFNVENDGGASLGSLKINYKNVIMEITRFRKEIYEENSTFPKIEKYLDDEEEDAQRRDFTINAIYLDVTNNHVVDPYDGIKDLFAFKVKFIGEPDIRIKQDPTRIIRALRLAYKMNFNIENATNEALLRNIDELKRLSLKRFNKEILKMEEQLGVEKTKKILNNYNIKWRDEDEH